MTFVLPWPPTTNHLYTVARGRKIKTQRARDYAYEVGIEVVRHLKANPLWRLPTSTDRLKVTLDMYPPDRRRFDVANKEKALVDAVAYALGFDDSQIDELTLRRLGVDRTNPRIVLKLERI